MDRTKQRRNDIDELLGTLTEATHMFPQLNLGQLLVNAIPGGIHGLHMTDDKKVIDWLKLYMKQYGHE